MECPSERALLIHICVHFCRARFIDKTLRRIPKRDSNGYWKILTSIDQSDQPVGSNGQSKLVHSNGHGQIEHNDNSSDVPTQDLDAILALCVHPQIPDTVPKVICIQNQTCIPKSGNVSGREYRQYRLSFWSGGGIGQNSALCLRRMMSDHFDTESDDVDHSNYFIHCKTAPNVKWQWYVWNSCTCCDLSSCRMSPDY